MTTLKSNLAKAFKSLALIVTLAFLTSCAVPMNTHYESARSLKKNTLEATANYTAYGNAGEVEQTNIGLRLGYGISDNFDLKLNYEYCSTSLSSRDYEQYKMNFFSISPKLTVIENIFAVKVPLNIYAPKYADGDSEVFFNFSPTVMLTYPVSKNFEVGMVGNYQLGSDSGLLGLSIGCGLSKNLELWSIRPEIGYTVEVGYPEHNVFNIGAAFTYNFDLNK